VLLLAFIQACKLVSNRSLSRSDSRHAFALCAWLLAATACGPPDPQHLVRNRPEPSDTGVVDAGADSPSDAGPVPVLHDVSVGDEDPLQEATWPPSACHGSTDADAGSFCQGPAAGEVGADNPTIQNASGCGTTLWGIARDFIGFGQAASTNPPGAPHPDFGSHYCCGNPRATVLFDLGADGKPAYNPANVPGDYNVGVGLTGREEFGQWYNDTPGVNLSYYVAFHLVPSEGGLTSVFASNRYFPVDAVGYGNYNDYGDDGQNHNFGFTTELHTKFKYQGGEVFAFEGDDDLWVFIDRKLAIDLGGIHSATPGEVALDDLATQWGLVKGEVYALDLFNAERHPAGSNFKITTSLMFVDCGVVPPVH
jgi:fibro-slime domain-containing protein